MEEALGCCASFGSCEPSPQPNNAQCEMVSLQTLDNCVHVMCFSVSTRIGAQQWRAGELQQRASVECKVE